MQTIHYFAGGNTARGFVSCFDAILPENRRKRMYFIKGGPGVGKSTLMRRFAEAVQKKGLEVELFHCSSDPDSLDGVSVPALGVGMMDGTAPHVYDPAVPGARDTLISLGDFLDEKALAPHAGEIADVQRRLSACFASCYRYLAASEQLLNALPVPEEDAQKISDTAARLTRHLPLRGGRGSVRRLFGSAFTPKGLVEITDLSLLERRVTVEVPFGAHASGLLTRIAQTAQERGLDVILLLDPLIPERILHAIIPAHGLAFCTGSRQTTGEWVESGEVFAPYAADSREDDRALGRLLHERALEALARAKELHDELERFYVHTMDHSRWQQVLDRLLSQLG